MNTAENITDLIRQSVERVTRKLLSQLASDAPLELDSINRISLIVDLENTFEIELDSVEVPPEAFFSLASLSEFIQTLR